MSDYPIIPDSARASELFRASPIPHLILPAPHSDLCLTPYYTGTRDYDQVYRLACLPSTVPYWGPKGPDDPKAEGIMKWTERWWTGAGAVWPLQMLRRTADVAQFDTANPPDVIGCIGFEREHFAMVPVENDERKALVAADREKTAEDGLWAFNMLVVDPEHGRRGVMSIVFRFVMDLWLRPLVGPQRKGFLSSAWEPPNQPSERWHKRNGFAIMGEYKKKGGSELHMKTAVWMGWEGERVVDKSETIFKDLPDVSAG